MASDTKNVKLGVCKVLFGGVDLGYTKGGVEVTVKTETHKVNIDQFGKTPINEYLMGRDVSVKVPLAETTLTNLVAVMPGAVLIQNGGAKATGTVTITTNPTAGQTITLAGQTVTFRAASASVALNEVLIGATAAATATNLAAFVNATSDAAIAAVGAVAAAAVVTLTADNKGVLVYSTVTGTAAGAVTMSAAALAGGADGTPARVDVPVSVGASLLDFAKVLTLHPIAKPDFDVSDDFTVFKAATAGALTYAYDLDKERIYSCEFNGYPDTANGDKLFAIGDLAAV